MKTPPRGPAIPDLRRSGRQFQICYNLKGVTLKKRNLESPKDSDWSIRQASIHHQFDVVYGTTLWIITKGRLDILERFQHLTGPEGRPEDKSFKDVYHCFRSNLAAHLMYCHWATEDWPGYISWLEDIIEREASDRARCKITSSADISSDFNGALWPTRADASAVQATSHTAATAMERSNERGSHGTGS